MYLKILCSLNYLVDIVDNVVFIHLKHTVFNMIICTSPEALSNSDVRCLSSVSAKPILSLRRRHGSHILPEVQRSATTVGNG